MITLSATEQNQLRELEEALWKSETRYNIDFQEATFAPDFFEFGRSGRRYTRQEQIRSHGPAIQAKFPLEKFTIHPLDENNVLVTYISEVQYEVLERANRCSVWSRSKSSWVLRFHQGTAI